MQYLVRSEITLRYLVVQTRWDSRQIVSIWYQGWVRNCLVAFTLVRRFQYNLISSSDKTSTTTLLHFGFFAFKPYWSLGWIGRILEYSCLILQSCVVNELSRRVVLRPCNSIMHTWLFGWCILFSMRSNQNWIVYRITKSFDLRSVRFCDILTWIFPQIWQLIVLE